MANDEDLARLRQGVAARNDWRGQHRESPVDLSGADLTGADLTGADLAEADLGGAKLTGADLRRTEHISRRVYRILEADMADDQLYYHTAELFSFDLRCSRTLDGPKLVQRCLNPRDYFDNGLGSSGHLFSSLGSSRRLALGDPGFTRRPHLLVHLLVGRFGRFLVSIFDGRAPDIDEGSIAIAAERLADLSEISEESRCKLTPSASAAAIATPMFRSGAC